MSLRLQMNYYDLYEGGGILPKHLIYRILFKILKQ